MDHSILLNNLNSSAPDIKKKALRSIRITDDPKLLDNNQVYQVVVNSLEDNDPGIQCAAALVLFHFPDRRANQSLRWHLLHDLSPQVRHICSWALSEVKDKRNITAFIKALKDPYAYVRSSSCRAIAKMGNPKHIAQLRSLFTDPDWGVRWDAAASAFILGDLSALDILKDFLNDPDIPTHYKRDLRRLYKSYKQGKSGEERGRLLMLTN